MRRTWSVGEEGALFLGVPGRVLSVAGRRAIVECWGVRMQVRLDFIDGAVEPGGYVLSHAGFAIRSISLEGGRARVQAGAGVVADSRPEAEYAEVQHKTRQARRALAAVAQEPRRSC